MVDISVVRDSNFFMISARVMSPMAEVAEEDDGGDKVGW
jgi:hypothetical protein